MKQFNSIVVTEAIVFTDLYLDLEEISYECFQKHSHKIGAVFGKKNPHKVECQASLELPFLRGVKIWRWQVFALSRKVPASTRELPVLSSPKQLTQNCPKVLICWDFKRASSSLSIRLLPWTTAALFTNIVTSPTWDYKSTTVRRRRRGGGMLENSLCIFHLLSWDDAVVLLHSCQKYSLLLYRYFRWSVIYIPDGRQSGSEPVHYRGDKDASQENTWPCVKGAQMKSLTFQVQNSFKAWPTFSLTTLACL